MSLTHQLEDLEARALLGAGWEAVAAALSSIRGDLQGNDPPTVLRVILLDAALRVASNLEDAVPFLANAERWARGQQLEHGAVELCLMWCQEVGRVDPGAVPEAVRDRAVAAAKALGGLDAQWRQALAQSSPSNIRLLTEALDHLQAPHQAHVRFQVLLDLAAANMDGGATPAAVAHLEDALRLAAAHDADDASLRVAAMLAQLHLVQGMNDHARPHLEHALSLAQRLDDPLCILTQSSLLAGLQLGAEEWAAADATAQVQIPAALRRGNWMAVADGSITQSTCALKRQDLAGALGALVAADARMRGLAPPAAQHLLRARLVELRIQLGAEVFDPLLQAALGAERSGDSGVAD